MIYMIYIRRAHPLGTLRIFFCGETLVVLFTVVWWHSWHTADQNAKLHQRRRTWNTLLRRHVGRGSFSNHQPHDCLLNHLFKTSKLRVTGLCARIHRGPVNSPHEGPVARKMFPFDDVIMRHCTAFCVMVIFLPRQSDRRPGGKSVLFLKWRIIL